MSEEKFQGLFTALITPFFKGAVDYDSLKKLIHLQISGGIQGFVVNGTTAESPTLTEEEVRQIYTFVRKEVGHDFPIVLGTGSNSTNKTISLTRYAAEWGADGALVVVPYYNKPTQEGLFLHFKSVAESCDLPIVLYNVPGRTITALDAETISRLSEIKRIVGIKEASGDMNFITELTEKCESGFSFSSGDDGSFLNFMALGGNGVISVVSHLIPKELRELMSEVKNSPDEVREKYKKYDSLLNAIYCEPNPIPIKMALYLKGIIRSPEMRLPLTEMTERNTMVLKKEMQSLGLI